MNTHPPVRCLTLDTRELTNETTSASEMGLEPGFPGASTIYARGFSSPVGLEHLAREPYHEKGTTLTF